MKTVKATTGDDASVWATVPDIAKALHCSFAAIRRWGQNGKFGYRQASPRRFEVHVPEAVEFYTKRYPGIKIDRKALSSMIQSTA